MQGTGFPHAERERLGVRGLLPPGTLSMERQVGSLPERNVTQIVSYYVTAKASNCLVKHIMSSLIQCYLSQSMSQQCGHV